jgi:hypothetical protein
LLVVINFVEREFRGWQVASPVQALFLILLAVICVLSSCLNCKLVSPVILGFLIKAGPKMAFYLKKKQLTV